MKRTIFNNQLLPWLLLAPQLAITFIFFIWPAAQAVWQSFLREDAFGIKTTFVGMENYWRLLDSPEYMNSLQVTAVFAVSVTLLSMGFSLLLAVAEMLDHLDMVEKGVRIRDAIRTTLEAHDRVTPDLGGDGTTETFGDALVERVRASA